MKQKSKIAVIGLKGLPAFGGAARSMENIIWNLKNEFDFTIYSISTHTKNKKLFGCVNQIILKGYRNRKLNILLYYLKSMFHVLFISNYDIVHVHHNEIGIIVPFLRLKYKVILTLHGVTDHRDTRYGFWGNLYISISEFLAIKFSNTIVSVSKPDIKYIKKLSNKKIIYIPNGINLSERISLIDIPCRDYLLFSAARIYELKGLHLFLEALKLLQYNNKVLVIGDIDHDSKYKKKIEILSNGLKIKYLGLLKDKNILMKYLENSKLFIFPSFSEAMSNMLLEAATMKTPIICSDIKSNKAIFNKNEVLFFCNGNSYDLSQKILYAINNYNKMKRKAENAYQKLSTNYNWHKLSQKYYNIYFQYNKIK